MTTFNAVAAIDALKRQLPEWQSTQQHADALREGFATRAFGETLGNPETAAISDKYDALSDGATRRQAVHRRYAQRAATFGFWAAFVAGLMLYLGATPATGTTGVVLSGMYVCFIAIALVAGGYVTVFKPYAGWIDARSTAERLRIQYFHTLMNANPAQEAEGSANISALKVEFVRAFLMDDQRDWFAKKAQEAEAEVKRSRRWRVAAFVLVFLASIPIAVSILQEPSIAATLPEGARSTLEWFGQLGARAGLDAKVLAFAGVAGGALQTWLTSLSAASLADRNAIVYRRMVTKLERMAEERLPAARTAAEVGDIKPIEDFWRELSFALIAEQEGWGDALQTAQLLTLDKFNPAPDSN